VDAFSRDSFFRAGLPLRVGLYAKTFLLHKKVTAPIPKANMPVILFASREASDKHFLFS
jgi:hypothetical protein